jgi:DNA-binding transcriptional LysR family regulator
METRLFEYFLEVTRTGSFASAARVLDIDPSIISRSISQLETELGARLFQRTTRTLALTEAGERFKNKIEDVVSEIDHIRDEIGPDNTSLKGRLCISASVAFGQTCIMPIVDKFYKAYPDIQLVLKFTDRNVDMITEKVDLAIRLAPSLDIDVIVSKLMDTHYSVCASPDYLKKNGALKNIQDFSTMDSVCFDLPEFRRRWLFKKKGGSIVEIPLKPKLVISNALGVRDATLQGLGIAMLPNWLIRNELRNGTLVDLSPTYSVTATDFETAAWLIYPNRSFLPRKTRLAIDFLRQEIGL